MADRMPDTNVYSEIFGTSEDESPELDHSEDSENGSDQEEDYAL
jgi:hypothetical protein